MSSSIDSSAPADSTLQPAVAPVAEPLAAEPAVDTSAAPADEALADHAEGDEAAVADAAAPAGGAAPQAPGMSPAACARELKQRFPALFGDAPKPLKLRIQADIQERAPGVFTKKALSIFLHRHTGSTGYLVALSKARQRFDLDGQPAGELAEEHRAAAAEELKRRRGLAEERRAVEDEQRRNRANLLRDFERTTLTRANFCALKGIAENELDTLLATIRQEIAAWEAQRPARPSGRPGGRPEGRRDGPRRDGRGGGEGRPPRGEGRGGRGGKPGA